MSNDFAIRVSGLGKEYVLGGAERVDESFREMLLGSLTAPFRRLKKLQGESVENDRFWALKDVNFEVKPGEVVGIIGRNGAGKSTLLKILSRITDPTEGKIEIRGRISSLLEVGTGFHPELTGRENIFLNGAILGMSRQEIKQKFDEIVAFAEVERFLDTPVKRYSSGMYVRLAFAVAAHLEPEILIVDEVLAVGDAAFQKKCLGKMSDVAKEGRTVLFVSHNMGAVSNLCSRAIVLSKGSVDFDGSTDDAVQYYYRQFLHSDNHRSNMSPHILYQAKLEEMKSLEFYMTSIEVLDINHEPKNIIQTWDDLVIRFSYRSARYVNRGSVVLFLSSMEGVKLLLLSTEPDGTLPLPLEDGEGSVDCIIRNLPLAAGEYVLGGGLAIPNAEWLCQQPELATFIVTPKDVYNSGLAPTSTRCLLAVEHEWSQVI